MRLNISLFFQFSMNTVAEANAMKTTSMSIVEEASDMMMIATNTDAIRMRIKP